MKRFMLRLAQVTCLAMMAVCLQSAQCESEEDEEGLPHYTKFVDISITSCERVGSVLMMDFTVKNKQNYDLNVELSRQIVTDDTGKEYSTGLGANLAYPGTGIAIADNKYENNTSVRLPAKGQVEGHLKVSQFSPNNTAKRVNAVIKVAIGNEKLSDKRFEQSNIRVVDNRLMSNGIQTNDFKMNYKVTSCKVENGDLYVKFNITNNTGVRLNNYNIGGGNYSIESNDNLGNTYSCNIKLADDERWAMFHNVSSDIAAGETISCIIRVEKIKANASDISTKLVVSSNNYIFNDMVVRFLSVPIEK